MAEWIGGLIESGGAIAVAMLMLLENLFPPIPSEVVMPLAGNAAAERKTSLPLVLAAGLTGTLAGSMLWYGVARWTGEDRLRRLARRYGRWLTMDDREIDRIQSFFARHGIWAIPLAHLVPGLRTMIAIPSGLFHVGPLRFLLLSAIGAGLWIGVLGGAGYLLGREVAGVERVLGWITTGLLVAALLLYLYRVITFRRIAAPTE